ncbi:restriction endonuclease subunit S [Catenibacterium mitsuokai]|uniref:restriction endonuclease subunit S n=1 Tax=Catenibacterium mitsuokai TaxID=100886 RepID=UPI00319E3A73
MEKSRKPKIRFKGYNDDWEQRKLEEILIQRIQHQKITSNVPLLAFSYAEGVIDPNDKKTNKRDFIMTDKYNKIFSKTEKNDIIYNPANVIHGAIHRNKLGIGVVSPIYKIFICQNINPKFLGERLHTDEFIAEIAKYIEGSVIKLRTLSPEQFLDMSIEVPSSRIEQEKIGSMFENLDNLITLHQRKLDKLINVKKSMLEKMFPKQGSTVPEIRFNGFTHDWEQRKLSEVASMHARIGWQNLRTSEFLDKGDYMLITGTDFVDGSIDYSTCHYVARERYEQDRNIQISNGSILITKDGTLGKVAYVQGLSVPATLNAGVFNLEIRNVDMIDEKYLFQYLKAPFLMDYVDKKSTGGTIKHLNQNILIDFTVIYPTKEEQALIGDYFQGIDNLITLHQRKLEKLKNIKKSMLEKMFI